MNKDKANGHQASNIKRICKVNETKTADIHQQELQSHMPHILATRMSEL